MKENTKANTLAPMWKKPTHSGSAIVLRVSETVDFSVRYSNANSIEITEADDIFMREEAAHEGGPEICECTGAQTGGFWKRNQQMHSI